MLTLQGPQYRLCDGLSRRSFLQVGALGGALTLADVLRLRAQGVAQAPARPRSVIMIWLFGGPSHIDMYDLKPDAPAEFRGEFRPIRTNLPGLDICELMPLQAKLADKMSLIRNMKYKGDVEHVPFELLTGVTKQNARPSVGSIVSRLREGQGGQLPAYVSLMGRIASTWEYPAYAGSAHKPFLPTGPGMDNLTLHSTMTPERLTERQTLLHTFDHLQRDLDTRQGELAGTDAFTARALDIIRSNRTRDAFDVNQEPDRVRDRYGKAVQFLQALRLAEAGVSVVTLDWPPNGNGPWDTHGGNFKTLRRFLPEFDQGVAALIGDLYERGLDRDVAVVIWGEMGRTPKINDKDGGRDHWYTAGFTLLAGGGLPMGQVIGATDARGEFFKGGFTTPQHVLATLYHVLGIDAARTTIPDHSGRPMYLLDDPQPVAELL